MEKIDVKEIKMCGCNIILLYKKMEKSEINYSKKKLKRKRS